MMEIPGTGMEWDYSDDEGEEMEQDAPVEKKVSVHACNTWNELRKNGQLCDVRLRVEGVEFPAHRTILAGCSQYFRALFTNGCTESAMSVIDIPGISAEMLELILEYAYTRDVHVNEANVQELLPAADQFNINGIVKECCKFLRRHLSPENVIGIREFSKSYFCPGLEKACYDFIITKFPDVMAGAPNEELQLLSVEDFENILADDYLNAKDEEFVFEGLVHWVNSDFPARVEYVPRLFQKVRVGLLNPDYFMSKVKTHELIKDNEVCKPRVVDAVKFFYDLELSNQALNDFTHPLAIPRIPYEVLFAVGGWSDRSPTPVVETYDTRADRWVDVEPRDSHPRAYHGIACLNQKLYVIGGFDSVEYFNSVRCFDPAKLCWSEVAPMNCRRCYVSVTVQGGHIFAMGGFDGQVRTNAAERYNPNNNQWSLIRHMTAQRSDASATALAGRVYICGGFNGQECLQSAEYYDSAVNEWISIANMRSRRSGIGVIAYRHYVYAVGGFNGANRLNTAERYDPGSNQWTMIPNMYNPRSNFGIEVIDDMLFVVGGFNGYTTICHVECYDERTNEWYDATDMSLYRSALSCGVMRGLPNREYFSIKKFSKSPPEANKKAEKAPNVPTRTQSVTTHEAMATDD
ncbi:kelch-like protein 10 [Branchiostoma lanceolatum]|uniref:kelch-like protein 10 n=1 Tax=Branchiostoma lanceolatum TaxID=7740 RepID=UPI0034570A4A